MRVSKTDVFKLVSWVAVLFRLWVRFRIVRDPGWDDLLVTLASVRGGIKIARKQSLIHPDHKHNSYHLCTDMYVYCAESTEASLTTRDSN